MPSLSPDQRALRRRRVARLRREGYSVRQIARRLGCSPATVDQDLRLLGHGGGADNNLSAGRRRPPRDRPRADKHLPGSGTFAVDGKGGASDAPPLVRSASDQIPAAVVLAGRLGDLAHAYTEGLRGEILRLRRMMVDERRRHAQELAAARAQGDRCRRDLEARLATETARAEELQERVGFAEARAEVAVGQLRALEARVPSTVLLNGVGARPDRGSHGALASPTVP